MTTSESRCHNVERYVAAIVS